MLQVNDIHTYYGETQVLKGLSMNVPRGSVVALLGRNGMGKTTTIRAIIGFTPPREGVIRLQGEDITHLPSFQIARRGVGLVPQGRRIFPSLSVRENLFMSARYSKNQRGWSLERVYTLFPILKDRAKLRANILSGGEQQMLAIGRALMTNPDLLLMDEPSEGLSVLFVREVGRVVFSLKEIGMSILVVEQNLSLALWISDYVYIVSKGINVYESTPGALKNNEEIKTKHLGVGGDAGSHP